MQDTTVQKIKNNERRGKKILSVRVKTYSMIIMCRANKTNASLETLIAQKIERSKELNTIEQGLF